MYAEATYEMTAGAFIPPNEADKRLLVMFNYHPHADQEASAKEGRPIFKDKVYIMIIVPGDKESIVHRPAYEADFQRFPVQYQKFQNKDLEAVSGTPLKALTWLTPSQIRELEYFNVRTVEHLATVTDNIAQRMHGLQGLKQRAQDFLVAAKGAAPALELRKQLEERDSQIAALQQQMTALATRLEETTKAKKEK